MANAVQSGLVTVGSGQPTEGYLRAHFCLPCGSLKGNHENMGEGKWKLAAHISILSVPNRNRYRVFVVVCGGVWRAESVGSLSFEC